MAKRVEPPKAIKEVAASFISLIRRRRADESAKPQAPATLKIAGYNLVLMDPDGQVAWTREWNAGDTFEFGPRYSLWIFCEFTNHSKHKIEIAEYEIELMGEDGMVIERFGNAFDESMIVVPGESKVFSGQWRL